MFDVHFNERSHDRAQTQSIVILTGSSIPEINRINYYIRIPFENISFANLLLRYDICYVI